MFSNIMVPVDLAHEDRLSKALSCAGELAKSSGATVTYVGVSAATPSSVAHTPEEFAKKLDAFAAAQGEKHGVTTRAHAVTSHDPATDLDPTLLKAVDETGADLVVMASHVPNITDYIWPSNGGSVAGHAKVSVLVVRD
ncbi:universal stress protein UspA [Oceanicola sp. 22II-s10i]|uniref:universal stress protein n=1 Tax=Oceanicola sp. 22II-s10i TaxID=1317116 RepID=UPI000B51F6A4|nr:universal stress protein [Oceanicola sp. 22II-s10i]OWU83461.1 universal stress protein UspA [Oceanicola sp. 22II-s10i]